MKDHMYDCFGDPIEEPHRSHRGPAPFDFGRLYGPEKYSLQDMLLKAVNWPNSGRFNGEAFDVWDDRIRAEWQEASKLIVSDMNGDAFFAGATNKSFMAFARKMAEVTDFGEITGARVVRFTNVSSGYPTLRLDLIREVK